MAIVKFEKLKEKISDFQAYAKERKGVEGKSDSDSIDFSEMNPTELKQLLKKYLHREKLEEGYRIISKSGTLAVVEKKYYEAEG
ncbi:MAG: hypothetical protein ACUVQ8_01805 [Nitrososphaeria archaeon]